MKNRKRSIGMMEDFSMNVPGQFENSIGTGAHLGLNHAYNGLQLSKKLALGRVFSLYHEAHGVRLDVDVDLAFRRAFLAVEGPAYGLREVEVDVIGLEDLDAAVVDIAL